MGKQDSDNILDILVILDRSGSMSDGQSDHEGGLRTFIKDQQSLPGDVRFTLVQFDSHDPCHIVFNRVPIQDVNAAKVELVPRGGTPLYAAIGQALAHMQASQAKQPSGQTIAMVITDGQDTGPNGEWNKANVAARVTELEKAGWSFLFLAANMAAFGQHADVGVGATRSLSYNMQGQQTATPASTAAMYGTISNSVGAFRVASANGVSANVAKSALNFMDNEREDVTTGSSTTFDGGAAKLRSVLKHTPSTTDAAPTAPYESEKK